jgi:hypothetical protein
MDKLSKSPRRWLNLLCVAALASASTAGAAGRPRAPIDELKSISDEVGVDAHRVVSEEIRSNMAPRAYTVSDDSPWAHPHAACARPYNQYMQAFGEFMARHVEATPGGDPGQNARSIYFMNERLRSDITRAAGLAQPGKAQFLEPGETLTARPQTWNAALRQRAEWTVVLSSVVGGLVQASHHNLDFGANYSAGVWTRMACDFEDGDAAFLKRWAAGGGAPASPRDQAALALLQSPGR